MKKYSLVDILKMDSMRARYLLGVVLLLVIFISSVWLTHHFISGAVTDTATNSLARNQLVNSHRIVREKLRAAEYALQAYLVTPEQHEYDHVVEQLDVAIKYLVDIQVSSWIEENNLTTNISSLSTDLLQLKKSARKLMDVRDDAIQLFPAYSTINEVMLPHNLQFISHIKLALDDLSTRLSETEIQQVYHLLSEAKDDWLSMVGAFRMYVASRTMSLRDPVDGNLEFENVIDFRYQSLRDKLASLNKRQTVHDLGVQVEASLAETLTISLQWYEAYQKIKSIYSSKNWRMDEYLMVEKIQPLQNRIWSHLNLIEKTLASSAQNDVGILVKLTSDVSSLLWLRMLIALVFIMAAFLAFEHWLLRPVAIISRALKAEAEGEDVEVLPQANTREARELIEAFEEMRSQVRIRQIELEHQAMHDSLTGLPNRLLLRRRLIESIELARQQQTVLALLMIDLDRFKEINDTLGHHMGDRVLKEIAPRFLSVLSKNDFLSRLGGDEFAVLLPGTSAERANAVAKKLCASLDADFNIDKQSLSVGSSIGIALYPSHGVDEQSLLQRADVAMYLAKNKNLNYVVYDENQDEHDVWQLSFEGKLRRAIEDNELDLFYQPKVSTATNNTVSVEALLRWHDAEHGLIPPDEIHLLAEKTGLIRPLTKWVIHAVIQQMSDWIDKGIDVTVSANLSVWNLQDPKLFDCVKNGLLEWQVPASRLVLEITESAVMSDPDRAMTTLNKLSRLGVKLSIDDFGIGFSSLHYLKKLPVDELKIDKSFVMDMIVDENDAVIVRSTIDLAHNLGMRVVAEGVESQEIYDLLQILRCDEAQGFHIAGAMSATQLEAWLDDSVWVNESAARLKLIK